MFRRDVNGKTAQWPRHARTRTTTHTANCEYRRVNGRGVTHRCGHRFAVCSPPIGSTPLAALECTPLHAGCLGGRTLGSGFRNARTTRQQQSHRCWAKHLRPLVRRCAVTTCPTRHATHYNNRPALAPRTGARSGRTCSHRTPFASTVVKSETVRPRTPSPPTLSLPLSWRPLPPPFHLYYCTDSTSSSSFRSRASARSSRTAARPASRSTSNAASSSLFFRCSFSTASTSRASALISFPVS